MAGHKNGFWCPNQDCRRRLAVTNTEPISGQRIRRRRKCPNCGIKVLTLETIQSKGETDACTTGESSDFEREDAVQPDRETPGD